MTNPPPPDPDQPPASGPPQPPGQPIPGQAPASGYPPQPGQPQAPGYPPAYGYPPAPGQQPAYGYAPPPPRRRLSTGLAVLLFVGIPLILLALIIAGTAGAVNLLRGDPVSQTVDADAGDSLFIDTPNAAIRLTPSEDDEIHVTMRGSYSGTRPRLEVTESGGETEIRGGCPHGWFIFNNCRVRIDVSLPADLDVTADGENGSITADALTGDLDLSTTNGRVDVEEASGILALHTTNGRIEVDDASSSEVRAETTNGAVTCRSRTHPMR